ncbi:MAG TPA: hypothetical protein VN776_09775 [Terracidiphilus sp.]|nr:hypothetical protein [Terracidiphilus sp.]
MHKLGKCFLAGLAAVALIPIAGASQEEQKPTTTSVPVSAAPAGVSDSLPPMEDPATVDQIKDYLRLSGEIDSFRASWIAAVDKNRSIGAPYWPESFWTAIKEEMQKTDLMPMYIVFYQHGISRGLMHEVLDAYQRLGADHFRGSPECFKLGDAVSLMSADWERIKLAKTRETISRVYAVYKPQMKAARARYLAEHPGWVDK